MRKKNEKDKDKNQKRYSIIEKKFHRENSRVIPAHHESRIVQNVCHFATN